MRPLRYAEAITVPARKALFHASPTCSGEFSVSVQTVTQADLSSPPRRGRPPRAVREPLTRKLVVAEALRLVDERGMVSLTMRALAQRLGVEAMSLYAYVSSKDDLLDAVAGLVASEVNLAPMPPGDWQGRIRRTVVAWAGMRERHPGGFRLLYGTHRTTNAPTELAVAEELMDALTVAGFDIPGVVLAYQTLIAFLDAALLDWPWSAPRNDESWRGLAAHIDPARYPRLASVASQASGLSWEEVFYSGLDLFLDGLEQRLRVLPVRTPES